VPVLSTWPADVPRIEVVAETVTRTMFVTRALRLGKWEIIARTPFRYTANVAFEDAPDTHKQVLAIGRSTGQIIRDSLA
jgi:hypothetical protein